MALEKITLDEGEVAGVKWAAIGISPACGFELKASIGSIERSGFSVHPLQLLSQEKREQMALELVLKAVAQKVNCSASETAAAAAEAIRALPGGDAAVDAAKRVADRFVRLRAATLRAADELAQRRRNGVVAAA